MANQGDFDAASPDRSPYMVLGMIIIAGVICLSSVAVFSLLVVGRSQSAPSAPAVQNVTVNNNGVAAAPTPPAGATRPVRADVVAGLPITNAPRIRVLVRQISTSNVSPLPNRLEGGPVGAVAASQSQGQAVASDDSVEYAPAVEEGQGLRLRVERLVKSSRLDPFVALQGYQILVADLTATNTGTQGTRFYPEGLEVQAGDHLGYFANPDLLDSPFPSTPLAAGADISWRCAFVVPSEVPLLRLVLSPDRGKPVAVALRPK